MIGRDVASAHVASCRVDSHEDKLLEEDKVPHLSKRSREDKI